jgi:uncharacterized membrane protein YvbJ
MADDQQTEIQRLQEENKNLKKWKKINNWTSLIFSLILLAILVYALI